MARVLLIALSGLIVFSASLYQLLLKDLIFDTFGLRRVLQPIEDFPYSCRRLKHKQLEACEDIWYDDDSRVLYAACTGTDHRLAWNQAMGKFNSSGRRPGGGGLVAIQVDQPGKDGLFVRQVIRPKGYDGATGDESLDFVGFDAERIDSSTIHFYLVNHRPPVDAQMKILDASRTGANTTIEVFEHKSGARTMQHLRTVLSPAVYTPNRVAIIGDGAFLVTNDHSDKVGFRKEFDPIIGGGNVAYCSASGDCHTATANRLRFPNGLARGKDGLIYVPSSVDGAIRVYELQDDRMLKMIDIVQLHMPLDNIAVDAKGDLYVAGFPNLPKLDKSLKKPYELDAPATVLRVRKTADGYVVDKAVEDGEGKIISGATTARHIVETGQIFIGAAVSPFMVVCDPKKTA